MWVILMIISLNNNNTTRMSNYKIWTQEEELKLKSLVGKISFKDMEKHFEGRKAAGLQSHSRAMNLDSPYIHKTQSKDEKFFETPNPLNCYWAGFLAADGYIQEGNRQSIKLKLSILDEEHIIKFRNDTKATNPLVKNMHKSPSSDNWGEMIGIQICSANKWVADLKKNFNLCQCKSHVLRGPNLSNDYLNLCFLIGYLDGDGCIHWNKKTNQAQIRIACCGLRILEWLKAFIDKNFDNISLKKGRRPNIIVRENHYIYCLGGLRAAKLFDLLRSMPLPKLSRKWENPEFLSLLATYKTKFPDFFTPEMVFSFDVSGNLIIPKYSDNLVEKV